MNRLAKLVAGAALLAGSVFALAAPAEARVHVGISFGYPGYAYDRPCRYSGYDNYAPPWGLPPRYCDYRVYREPVYWGGSWYRGPIYYRHHHGRPQYWLHGGWRYDEWRGARPRSIRWDDRGGWRGRGHRGGWDHHGRDRYHGRHH